MTPVRQPPQTQRSTAPRILVVDDEFDVVDFITDALNRNIDCRLTSASNRSEAARINRIRTGRSPHRRSQSSDGDGAELVTELAKRHPLASAIVVTGAPSVETAVSALRQGAVDFVSKPFTPDEFLRCVRTALHRNAVRVKSESRIDRLRVAVRPS